MPTNPGDRYAVPTTEQVERVVRGTIFYFNPILDGLLVLVAVTLALIGATIPALAVAYVAGRVGGR